MPTPRRCTAASFIANYGAGRLYRTKKTKTRRSTDQDSDWSTHLRDIVIRAKALPRPIGGFFLFCNRKGQPYTDRGFKAMWNRLQVEYAQEGGRRFTFHDLRAYYVTEGKE